MDPITKKEVVVQKNKLYGHFKSRVLVKAQKDLSAKMDAAAKSQSPKAPRDSSPAGAQRRANAAARARD